MAGIIATEELARYGVRQQHEEMENGELRFRLMGADGSGYIRCENRGEAVWENSHCHGALRELVLVQRGEVVYAEYVDGRAEFTLLRAGELAFTRPMIPHNECVGAGAVVHTVKYGDCENADWRASPELDAATKPLSFSAAKALCGRG